MNDCQIANLARGLSVVTVVVLTTFATSCQAASEREAVERETQAYYAQWIGVRAPEFENLVRNRNKGERLRIQDAHGKRLLLYSFDAGDFVDLPDEAALVAQLTGLKQARQAHTNDLAVIGFTYGAILFFPGRESPASLRPLTDFPIVNNTNVELEEPYNILQRWPSAILIDRNGIIIGVYPKTLTGEQLAESLSQSDWEGQPRRAPKSGPPEVVINYSSRKPFFIFVYRKDLERRSRFQREFGQRSKVYLREEVPQDAVESMKEVEGKTLRTSVRKGSPIRKGDFDE